MRDRLLVEALRSGDPAAIGAVYDEYADRLYGYCWFQLRTADAASAALRDALICAQAHIAELRDPERFAPWLYTLARIECRRRRPVEAAQPDLPIARHDQDDVDLRLMAWRAVTALPALSREILDLRYRHELSEEDLPLVVALPGREVRELLTQARVLLEAALIAEILVHEGPFSCPERVAILRGRTDRIDDDLREALVRHSLECRQCVRRLPSGIAPAKVYALLPEAAAPEALRAQILRRFTDADPAGRRRSTAARITRFGWHGFPEQPWAGRTAARHRATHRWPRALAALSGAALAAVAAGVASRWFGEGPSHGPDRIFAASAAPREPRPSPAPPVPSAVARPIAATYPLVAHDPASPASALDGDLPGSYLRAPRTARLEATPARLTVGAGGTGTLTLRAAGNTADWRATAGGPLRLSPAAGTLPMGAARTIEVRVHADHPGTGLITFEPGGVRVAVTWTGTPPDSPPPTTPPPTSPPPTSPPPTSPPPTPTTPPPTTPPTTPPPSSPTTAGPAPTPSRERPPEAPERP